MMKSDVKRTLMNTRLKRYLSPHAMELLLTYSEIHVFSKGQVILKQGKLSHGLYIIVQGTVAACAKMLGEGLTCLTELKCGNFFGEISVIAKKPSETSFIADEEVCCLFMKEVHFNMLNLFFAETKYQITQAICIDMLERIKGLQNTIIFALQQSAIQSRSVFKEVIRSFTKPTQITFDETHFTINEIKKMQFFNQFNDVEVEELIKQSVFINAPKNCVLLRDGEVAQSYFIILRGAVQSNIVYDGKFAKLSVLGPFKFFSPLSIVDPTTPSLINYTTCERAIILQMPEENLLNIKKHHEHIWYKFFNLVSKSLAILERTANELDLRLKTEFYNRG